MGSAPSHEDKQANARSREIDYSIAKEKRQQDGALKLLLLGPGEAGKSTIVKQMRILHDQGFSKDEYLSRRYIIYSVTVKMLIATADAFLRTEKWKFANPESSEALLTLLRLTAADDVVTQITSELALAMKTLWTDQALTSYFVADFQRTSDDGNFHFLRNLDRILSPDYCPSEQDILQLRIPTCGVVEISFKIDDIVFRVIDVGGQKALRRKWIHAFEDVNAVIFLAALSDYNINMREDTSMNRMRDALQLFDGIGNSSWFKRSCIILFLNKKDLFAEKLKRTSLRKCFTGYKGDDSFDDAVKYVEKRFLHLIADDEKEIYVHVTCATDTNQMQLVLESCISTIRSKNISRVALN